MSAAEEVIQEQLVAHGASVANAKTTAHLLVQTVLQVQHCLGVILGLITSKQVLDTVCVPKKSPHIQYTN